MYPVFIYTTPPTCPNCGKGENKKEVCRHCDYVYKESGLTFMEALVLIIGFILWIGLTGWLAMCAVEYESWLIGIAAFFVLIVPMAYFLSMK